jgi:uncharacterized protein YjbI with pentapeptide repeats
MSDAQPQTPPDAYGQPISAERQAELQGYLDRWETEHGERRGPFDGGHGKEGVRLSGADVSWLAEHSGRDTYIKVPNLHLEGADLNEAHLEGAYLGEAHLERAILTGAHLEGAYLGGAHLERTYLGGAHLEEAGLSGAHLEGADLKEAHLERAYLLAAHLEDAILNLAYLEGAILDDAHLERAYLLAAHLEDAILRGTHLEGADLRGAFLDAATEVSAAVWTAPRQATVGPQLADVRWGGVNLTAVGWERIKTLRDEQIAKARRDEYKNRKRRQMRIEEYKAAGRAYRLLFVVLRAQGLTAPATRYHYRAEVMDRKALWHARSPFRWLFSWLLGTFAGYGDRLGRLFATYGITVGLFALLMLGAVLQTGAAISLDTIRDTLVLSVTSFHGRGIQPPGLPLDDTLATLAGLEAVFGLLIEGLFIAAFTRRVTGG